MVGIPALLDQRAHLVRVGGVADEVASAVDGIDVGPLKRLEYRVQGRQVGVDVGDDRDPLHRRPAVQALTNFISIDIRRSMSVDLELAPKQKRPAGQPCCEPVVYPDVEREQAERMAAIAKALADPVRLQLVDVLRKHAGKVCVCELVPLFDLSQPTVSHHLKVLRDAGLVDSERRGLWAYYYVIPDALEDLAAWLS
jgi:ArsR family transcriptional regulator, arsenate/arsenite/antimonite-responsive transcriptional repressor